MASKKQASQSVVVDENKTKSDWNITIYQQSAVKYSSPTAQRMTMNWLLQAFRDRHDKNTKNYTYIINNNILNWLRWFNINARSTLLLQYSGCYNLGPILSIPHLDDKWQKVTFYESAEKEITYFYVYYQQFVIGHF
jgi:hypothetical protein